MSVLRVLAILLAAGIGIWQYELVANHERSKISRTSTPTELMFTMNDGRAVSIPNDTSKFSAVLFWSMSSDRSVAMLREMLEIHQGGEFDSIVNIFLVNLDDPIEEIRHQVEFDNFDLPFGYQPTGQFLKEFQIRALPVTVFFTAKGTVFTTIEGFAEAGLKSKFEQVARARDVFGPSGEIKFKID